MPYAMFNKINGRAYIDWDMKPKIFATREEALDEFEGDPHNDTQPATPDEIAEWEIREV